MYVALVEIQRLRQTVTYNSGEEDLLAALLSLLSCSNSESAIWSVVHTKVYRNTQRVLRDLSVEVIILMLLV